LTKLDTVGRANKGRKHAQIREAISDIGIGMIGGYVGTQVMERVSMKLYKLESEEDRKQEEEVRPGPPFEIAARKTAEALGIELSEEQLQKVATYGFHYGLGMRWGPTYTLLRKWTGLNPVSAGLLSGALMSLIVDEGMTPFFGFSAPNRDYPPSTHLRGFAAHLAFGLGVAGTAETLYWLGRNGGARAGDCGG
jgi:hypothetical protein